MLKKRQFTFSAALLVLALGLSGFVPGAAASAPQQIVFRTFDPPSETAGLQKAVDEWNKVHVVKVKMETIAIADALAQYSREVNAKSGPDIAQQAFVWVRDLAKAGLVQNLDTLATQSSPSRKGVKDFLARDLNTLNGKLYGLPWSVDTYAMVYDPTVLTKAGYKRLPGDWNGFAEAVKKMTSPGRSGFCFAASSGPTSDAWHLLNYYLWSQNTPLIKQEGATWKLGVTNTQLTAAFTYLNNFFTSGTTPKNMLSADNAGDPAINNAVADGRCAVAFMTPSNLKVALQTNSRLISASVPTGVAGVPTTHMGGRSLTINPNSKNKQAAWQFVRYLSTQKVFQKYYSGQFPAQQSLLNQIRFNAAKKGFATELVTARTYAMYVDSPAPTSKYWSITAQALGSVFSGQNSPSSGAAAYAASISALLG